MGAVKHSNIPTSDRDERPVPRRQNEATRVSDLRTISGRFNVKQAAAYAGVCPSIIYKLCAAQVLEHYRVGGLGRRGKIVILKADVDAYLATCRVGPKQRTTVPARRSRPKLRHLRLPS